jgi:hypothetical protein
MFADCPTYGTSQHVLSGNSYRPSFGPELADENISPSAIPWTIPMNPGNLGTETGSTAAFGGSA